MNYLKQFCSLVLVAFPMLSIAQPILSGVGNSDGNYTAHKANDIITIDGKGNEKDWNKADWKEVKYVWIGDVPSKADFQGRYKMLWDSNQLYFLVEIYDDSLSDQQPDPFINWWEDDCLELFIDEDHSKGNHQYNYNAFAYHITLDYDVIDMGPDQKPRNFKEHLKAKRTKKGNVYTWEVAMKVFDDTYDEAKQNVPVKLYEGKTLGFAVSYNDNDGTHKRENFIGSINIEGEDKNKGWIDAGVFGTLNLVK